MEQIPYRDNVTLPGLRVLDTGDATVCSRAPTGLTVEKTLACPETFVKDTAVSEHRPPRKPCGTSGTLLTCTGHRHPARGAGRTGAEPKARAGGYVDCT